MNLEQLEVLVGKCLVEQPKQEILDRSNPYYSRYYSLLYLLAKHFSTRINNPLFVELGVESGRGCFSMLLGNARVIGVDNNPDRKDVLSENPNFTMIIGSSLPVPDAIKACGKSIQCIHLDDEHSYAQVREEFNAYKEFLVDGAIVCFDDVHAAEDDVKRFTDSLPYEKIYSDALHECGYCVMIYKEERETV